MEHVNVIIASPGYDFDWRYVNSLTKTLTELDKRNITYKWVGIAIPIISTAREAILGRNVSNEIDLSIKTPLGQQLTYDKIFWIDSDMVWTSEDFLKLYDSELDVVSGYYINTNKDKFITNLLDKELDFIFPSIEDKEIIEIGAAGFGFIAVKKGVFEKLERPWFMLGQIPTDDEERPIVIQVGEDITWCVRVRQKGFKIHADLSARIGHIKPKVLMPGDTMDVEYV